MSAGSHRLGDLYEFLPKSSLKASNGRPEGRYPFFTSSPSQTRWTDAPIYDAEALVFATGGAAAVHHVIGRFSASADCLVVAPRRSKAVHPKFSCYYLNWDIGAIEAGFRGAGLRHVAKRFIEELALPDFTIAEQRRVAEILDKADALRTKRRAALAQLDALTQSIFLHMFGDRSLHESWPTSTVGELADVQGGLQVSSAREGLPLSVPYLRVANVHRGLLNLDEIKQIQATEAEIARTRLVVGDVLVVEGHGNPDEIGRAALWNGSVTLCVHQNHLIRVRFDQRRIVPLFGCMYVNSAVGRRHLLRSGKTTSGLSTINVSEVRATPLIVPPIELQEEFVRQIERVDRVRDAQLSHAAHLDALFSSLQHRAFRGEL